MSLSTSSTNRALIWSQNFPDILLRIELFQDARHDNATDYDSARYAYHVEVDDSNQ